MTPVENIAAIPPQSERCLLRLFAILFGTLSLPLPAFAQAWTPPKGEGDISVSYLNVSVQDHLNGDGTRFFAGDITSQSVVHTIDYGATDRWAVSLSLPFSTAKYVGDRPHQLPIDNGHYRGAFSDFRFTVRFNMSARPMMLTPFFALGIPSHGYTYFAHSAVGTDQREYAFGLNAGRSLRPFLPRAYFQARYSYGVMEEVLGIRPNRSRLDGELGYFVTKRMSFKAVESLQLTHNGLDVPGDFLIHEGDRWLHHDQISRINYLNIGVGLGYSITKSWDVFASMATTLWGQNGHTMATGIVIGSSWSFRTHWARPQLGHASAEIAQHPLPGQSPASTPHMH